METTPLILITVAVGVVAFLYAAVGHGGASGYIAVMTLAGCAVTEIKPTSLILNILVAGIGAFQFGRAGYFSWKLFWPFALLAVPTAYLGAALPVSISIIKPLLGVVLWTSAVLLFVIPEAPTEIAPPRLSIALPLGASMGLLSGLTGTGGGIFLTPLLLLMRWAHTRHAAATSAVFVLVNSISGLAGHMISGKAVPAMAGWLAFSAIVGGTLGSYLGSRRLPPRVIRGFLALALTVAGMKLLYTH